MGVGLTLKEGWGELVGRYSLPVFPTLTFAKRTHPESALKAFRYATHHLSCALHGKNYSRRGEPGIQYVAAIERQKNWNPHVHALMGDPGLDLGATDYVPILADFKRFCEEEWGFARIERITAPEDCRSYVIDYAAKTGELYFSPHLEATRYAHRALC